MTNKRTWVTTQVKKSLNLSDLQTITALINAYMRTYRDKTNPKSILKDPKRHFYFGQYLTAYNMISILSAWP